MKAVSLFLGAVCLMVAYSGVVSAQETQRPKKQKAKPLADQVSGQGYGTAGCGLGSIAFGDKPGAIQIVAATLNGTLGSQTFGITSGTSNCVDDNARNDASLFIEVNRVALMTDASRGQGETLNNLSSLVGCSDSHAFGKAMQKNYQNIFGNDKATSSDVDHSIRQTIKNDKLLTQTCNQVG